MGLKCANCGDELGVKPGSDKPGQMPFTVNDGDEGKAESFCPQCFCHHRAPMEMDRFPPHRAALGKGGWRAVKCCNPRCGVISASGSHSCANCGFHVVINLPPKPKSGSMGWSAEALAIADLKAPKVS